MAAVGVIGALAGAAGVYVSPIAVAPSTPSATAAAACVALAQQLPDAIDEGARRRVQPGSPYTAAWGRPAIVLTCGVDQPAEYELTSELIGVNDVFWLAVREPGGYAMYATGLAAWIRVDVPDAYQPPTFALTDLSDVIARVGLATGAA